MIGEKLSEATLLGFLTRVHDALAGWETRARQYLLAMPAMHVDETSLRVEKKKPWIHVYSAGEITLKFLRAPWKGAPSLRVRTPPGNCRSSR